MTLGLLVEKLPVMIAVFALNPALATRVRLGPGRMTQDLPAQEVSAFVADKAINAFRTLHALRPGTHRLVVVVGGHVGRGIVAELEREGLPHQALWVESESRRTVVVERESSFAQYEWKGPRRIGDAELKGLTQHLPPLAPPGGMVMIAGSLPAGPALNAWVPLFTAIAETGGRVCLDSSQTRALLAEGITPWLVKVNRREWGEGADLAGDARRVATERGMGAVIVTDGPRGAVAATAAGAWRVRPRWRRRGWAVGCGDAFAGGLGLALDQGLPIEEALVTATACALANLKSPIHGAVAPAEVERARAEVVVETLGNV